MPAASPVPEEFALLVSYFAAITDLRLARGKIQPLPRVLALVVLGVMAGCCSLSAMSRYGQIHPEVLAPLGLRRSPSVATMRRTPGKGVDPVAVDGKTLRGLGRR